MCDVRSCVAGFPTGVWEALRKYGDREEGCSLLDVWCQVLCRRLSNRSLRIALEAWRPWGRLLAPRCVMSGLVSQAFQQEFEKRSGSMATVRKVARSQMCDVRSCVAGFPTGVWEALWKHGDREEGCSLLDVWCQVLCRRLSNRSLRSALEVWQPWGRLLAPRCVMSGLVSQAFQQEFEKRSGSMATVRKVARS